ncbi:MAG TPA: O-antigen ligase family protein [Patescibacteria group bacterium]|nr:O-antigen ligase family protein [Patescibacteria group bacterium]
MWLLALMILIMPFEANPYLYIAPNFLGVFPDFTVIKLLGLAGFAWAMVRLASGHPHGALLTSRPAALFLMFFCGVLFAGLFSGSGFLAISRYLAFLTFLPFVLVSVQTQQDLGRVLRVMVLSLVLVFPYALRQMVRFNDRLGVGLYETNYFATILVLVIPLAFVFASQASIPSPRWLWTMAGLLLVLELFLTSSRGGFLGLLVAGMVFIYRRRGLMGAVGVMAILLLGLIIVPTDLGSRMWTVFETEAAAPAGLEASNKAHLALFFAALRMIADNPIFGVGPLNFKSLSTLYTGLEQGNIAHNSFLEVAAEFGLPVFVVFVLLLVATFRILNRAARLGVSPEGRRLAGWAEGLRSGLIGFLVAGCFISAQYEKMLWLAVFVTIVLGRFAAEVRAAEVAEPADGDDVALEPLPEPTR